MSPDPEPSTPSGLHRSCIFCRARKIRCSSGPICTACRERNINCIYSPEARKGRPRRGTGSSGHRRQPRQPQRYPLSSLTSPPAEIASSAASEIVPTASSVRRLSQTASPQPTHPAENDGAGIEGSKGDRTLGHELEQMFHEYFIRTNASRSNLFQDFIVSFQRRVRNRSPGNTSTQQPRPKFSCDGIFSFLAHEMVQILLRRFGQLGCEQPESSAHQYYYIASLAEDTTPSMFDPPCCQKGPLTSLGKHRVVQMVHLWFSMHPLSPLVSKTLLLGAIQDETVDEALLAVILADAFQALDSSDGQRRDTPPEESPQLLTHFAASQLRHRPLSHIESAPISAAQALFLLGWRDLAQGNGRRSTCYIGYTCRVTARQYQRRSRNGSMKLNGIDIRQLEQEILQNIYWLCLSATTWAFMQVDQPFTILLPDEIPDFPCIDETTSTVLQLDRAANNISTLPSQVRAMRWLWPLSHVTSTVAHIYTLYLNSPTEERKVKAAPWHTQHIHQLQKRLWTRFEPFNLPFEVQTILIQAIKLVEQEVRTPHTQSFLLTSYYTIIVHMLFSPERLAPQPITPSTVQVLGECISAILTISARVPSLPVSPAPTQAVARALALGLDACSRALVRLHNHCQHDWQQKEDWKAIPAVNKLADYAESAHQLCKADFLGQHASILRPVKKRLKWVKSALRILGTPTSIPVLNDTANTSFLSLSPPTDFPLLFDRPGDLGLSTGSSSADLDSLSDLMSAPVEIPDPGFFCDDPSLDLDSLLEFPGIARAADLYPTACDDSFPHHQGGRVLGDLENTGTLALDDQFFMDADIASAGLDSLLNSNAFDGALAAFNSPMALASDRTVEDGLGEEGMQYNFTSGLPM